jgi:hypothetical protein
MPDSTNAQRALPMTTNARYSGRPPAPMTSSMKTRIRADDTGFATE